MILILGEALIDLIPDAENDGERHKAPSHAVRTFIDLARAGARTSSRPDCATLRGPTVIEVSPRC